MSGIWQDVRYGLRRLLKQPGFTVISVVTLALGVGAATTIFSVIHSVLLDPFPYKDADRVANLVIQDLSVARPTGRSAFPLAEFLEYRDSNRTFEEAIGGGHFDVLIRTDGGPEQFDGSYVTPNTFQFLGVPALVGRGLLPEDAAPGAPPVFVMSYKMWQNRYSKDPSILGRSFTMNNVPTTLVGIMPPRFTKFAADLWVAVPLDRGNPEIARKNFRFQARLKPGVTLEQAKADLEPIARRLAAINPKNYPARFSVRVVSWVDALVVQFRTTLYSLAAAVGLLLLIACSNVANLLLAQGSVREKEIAMRASLGGTRWRVVRQLLIESSLLAFCGAVLGVGVSYLGITALAPLLPILLLPSEVALGLNAYAVGFAIALTVVTVLFFGLVPAMHTARRDVVESLKDSGKGVGGGSGGARIRNALVVIEVALSMVLLVCGGLLMRTVVEMQRVDLGLDSSRILVARVPLPPGQYDTAEAKQKFFQTLLQRLHALPGVVSAAESTGLPTYGLPMYGRVAGEVDVPGRVHTERWDAAYQLISEGYFKTLGLRLVRGRGLSEVDVTDARRVVVVNQTLVNRYIGPGDPIGRQLKLTMLEGLPKGKIESGNFEIVGVIADVKNLGIQESPMPEVLVPYTITGAFDRSIVVKTAGEPGALLNNVRREIWAVDGNVALTFAGTLDSYLHMFSYAEPQFAFAILIAFAGLGLLLTVIGVYSVIRYAVSRRTHEIGVRMALGATPRDVLLMVIGMGFKSVAAGLVVGVIASLAMARVLSSQLFGVTPYDPVTLLGVVGIVAAVGVLACYVPARKATVVDPIISLKPE